MRYRKSKLAVSLFLKRQFSPKLKVLPAGTCRRIICVVLTLMRRDDVASTSLRRHFDVMCQLGIVSFYVRFCLGMCERVVSRILDHGVAGPAGGEILIWIITVLPMSLFIYPALKYRYDSSAGIRIRQDIFALFQPCEISRNISYLTLLEARIISIVKGFHCTQPYIITHPSS